MLNPRPDLGCRFEEKKMLTLKTCCISELPRVLPVPESFPKLGTLQLRDGRAPGPALPCVSHTQEETETREGEPLAQGHTAHKCCAKLEATP